MQDLIRDCSLDQQPQNRREGKQKKRKGEGEGVREERENGLGVRVKRREGKEGQELRWLHDWAERRWSCDTVSRTESPMLQ